MLARVRSEVARERFVADHGREPKTARELSDALARYSRPRQTAVAGFDLTFSPVKSVSALWAVAPAEVARAIEEAHDAAVRDALAFIEREALFTREGRNGARQVETRGLIATAFTHRDSRAGDPDLHTHVAVANKVQTRSGKWLSIYGTVLHEHVVAASETYNTALERRLVEALGVVFVERPGGARDKRPVREIDGVPAELCERWSERRKAITARQRELAREFKRAHGRPPTPVEAVALAQQANLETREAKHEPRSEAEQRATWRAEAVEVLGSARSLDDMVSSLPRAAAQPSVTAAWIREAAERVIAEVESRRATWQVWHLRAEAQRQVREVAVPADRVAEVVEWIVDDAIGRLSVNLTPDVDPIPEPAGLRRSDGTSVYRHTGRDHYTSRRVLEAEQRIVALAGRYDGLAWSPDEVELSVLASALEGVRLNRGQEVLVTAMATSGARVQLALAPAGSGKTTAMQVLANVWTEGGCNVLGLAPSAAAAAALAEATGMPCETLAKLTHDLAHVPDSDLVGSIGPGTLVVIDEAGMADTLTLASVIELAVARGASVRLIGDDRQLAAIGAGGLLRDIASTHGAIRLDELVRFTDPGEGEASLSLRDGDRAALGFYLDNDRVHVGDVASCLDDVFEAWSRERAGGRDCLMLAPTRELVRELNLRAQASRGVVGGSVGLADGCSAHRGDVVISRRNDRRLGVSGTDWVKNGDRWIVTDVRADGALSVRHATSRLHATLPAAYVSRACRARLRLDRPHRPGHHHRRRPRDRHRHRGPPDALHDAHPRPGREPRPHRAHRRADARAAVADGRAGDDGDRGARRHPRPRRSRRLRNVDAGPCHVARSAVAGRRRSVRGRSCARNVPDASEPRPRRARSAPLARRHPFRGGVALGMGSVPRRPVPPSLVARRRGRRRSRAAGVDGEVRRRPHPGAQARTGGLASSHRRTRRRANAGRARAARRPGGGVPPQPHQPDQRPLRRGREDLGRPHRRVRRQARRADR